MAASNNEKIELFEVMLTAQSNYIYDRIKNEQDRATFLETVYLLHKRILATKDFEALHRMVFGYYKRSVTDKYQWRFFSNPRKYTVMANQMALGIAQSIDTRFNGFYYYE